MKPSPVIIEYQRVCCLLEVIITGNGGALSLYLIWSLIIFYTKDVLSAGQKVLVYLPDGGHCDSAEDCKERCGINMTVTKYDHTMLCYRCSDTSPETCTTAENNFMDLSDGIWSSSQDDNPFADYFKVYIHYCTNDDYSGEFEAEDLWSW